MLLDDKLLNKVSEREVSRCGFRVPYAPQPNVRKPIHEVFGEDLTRPNFFFIEPLQYLEFVYLM